MDRLGKGHSPVFSPFSFSGLALKNRIVRAATYEKMADDDGFVTDEIVGLYEGLARGGSGLIITGNALVHPSGRAQPRMLCLHSDIYIPGLKRLAGAVHAIGGLIAIQLNHGGRQSTPFLLGGRSPLAPSEVYNPTTEAMPRAMTDAEVWEMVDAFGAAAERAEAAGFDAIEIHAAHGFLISSFLSPHTNLRDDYWGGDEERRFHFIEEIFLSGRRAGIPIIVKINSEDFLPEGLTVEESLRVTRRLEALGLDAVEVSGGMRESPLKPARQGISAPEDEAYFRGASRLFKKTLGVPVILTGGMRSKAVMEDVITGGDADLIGMSRPLIRQPDLPNRLKAGPNRLNEGSEKAECLSCNRCMHWHKLPHVRCRGGGADQGGHSDLTHPDDELLK
jgi:2,4-dienoyl-CoA reductase-like NADH-dependent reductase (Old Yellow Enzyme family)